MNDGATATEDPPGMARDDQGDAVLKAAIRVVAANRILGPGKTTERLIERLGCAIDESMRDRRPDIHAADGAQSLWEFTRGGMFHDFDC
jgi:hypothetical protein